MYGNFRKLIACCVSAACIAGNVCTAPAAAFASTMENDTAVAGIELYLSNFFSQNDTAEADIMDYLQPMVTVQKAVEETTASVNVKVKSTDAADEEDQKNGSLIAEDAEVQESGLVSTLGCLNVREKPTTSSPIVGYLYSNCKVDIYDTVINGEEIWYLIRSDGVEGYVSASFVLTGEAAKTAEADIQNKYATVTVDQLDVYSSAASAGEVIGNVYKDEQYPVMEIQGDFVKIRISDDLWGYVDKDSVKITTQFASAVAIDDNYIKTILDSALTEIDDGMSIYESRYALHDYSGAASAIDYVIENWKYYIQVATDAGYDNLVVEAQAQLAEAQLLSEGVNKIVADLAQEAIQNPVTPSSAAPQETPAESSAAGSEPAGTTDAAAEQQPTEPSIASPVEQTPLTDKQVVAIEAYYQGGTKYAGDMIYAAELYLIVTYEDGTTGVITDHDLWSSPDVGMILAEGPKVVTMYYGELHSSFMITVYPAQTSLPSTDPAPSSDIPTETQPVSSEIPTETQPASSEIPTETQPVSFEVPTETLPASSETPTETQPASSEETTAPAAVITSIEACYNGGTKYAGDVIYSSDVFVRVYYSDGSYIDVTDPSQWYCPVVGMTLAEGEKLITMAYAGMTSNVVIYVQPAATVPASESVAPTLPAETVPATSVEIPTAPAETTAPAIAGITACYGGFTKYAGEVLSASELFVRVTYSDGSYVDVTDPSMWYCPQVGTVLSEGNLLISMTYAGYTSSFSIYVQPSAIVAPTETAPAAADTTAPAVVETTAPAVIETTAPASTVSASRQQVVDLAAYWVGKCNYVLGGNSLTIGGAVDCSAFTMFIYQTVGISLSRSATAQIYSGTHITYDQLRPGDLVCYSGHVAIYIGDGMIIHAKNPTEGITYDSVFFSAKQPPIAYISLLP